LGQFEWVGFWDADLATPLSEIHYFLNYQQTFAPEKKLIFGSRILRYGSHIVRDPFRHYLSRIFVTFTDFILGIKCYDSQCGAKLFHKSVVDTIFKEKFLSRWVFDLEIIKRTDKNLILEVPVRQWQDIPGSKIKFFREIFRVLNDLFRIQKHYK
jgi:dolichyl-phosphate beta-glucosyltransferase